MLPVCTRVVFYFTVSVLFQRAAIRNISESCEFKNSHLALLALPIIMKIESSASPSWPVLLWRLEIRALGEIERR